MSHRLTGAHGEEPSSDSVVSWLSLSAHSFHDRLSVLSALERPKAEAPVSQTRHGNKFLGVCTAMNLYPSCFCGHQGATHSSSLESSSSSLSIFFAGFFLFLDFFFPPVDFDIGRSKIFRIPSSVIFLSDFTLSRYGDGGAASRVIPFLVIASKVVRVSYIAREIAHRAGQEKHTDRSQQP